jgi:hypothetical protein
MSLFTSNPLINPKIVKDIASFMEANNKDEKKLSPIFLEEAQKAAIALSFCESIEDKKNIKKEYFRIAVEKSGEEANQNTLSEFDNAVNKFSN